MSGDEHRDPRLSASLLLHLPCSDRGLVTLACSAWKPHTEPGTLQKQDSIICANYTDHKMAYWVCSLCKPEADSSAVVVITGENQARKNKSQALSDLDGVSALL